MTARLMSVQEVAMRHRMYENPVQCGDGTWLFANALGAAFLVARGNRCIGTTPTKDKSKSAFVIAPRAEFLEDLRDWHANGTVGVRDLQRNFAFLKGLLRSSSN
jgi:hypothetical protein